MEELVRLPLWYAPGFQEIDMAPIREAKAQLNLPFKVKPVPMRNDIDERVLAIGSKPKFLCDYALWSGRTGAAGLTAALAWVLSDEDDPRATTIEDTLRSIMPGTREIPQEELDSELRMYQYLNRIV
jgi:hypothetical protein